MIDVTWSSARAATLQHHEQPGADRPAQPGQPPTATTPLRNSYGVNVVLGDASAIDPVGVKVTLASGRC